MENKIKKNENCVTFGVAIKEMKNGKKVARRGWNGKGMWISLLSSLDIGISNGEDRSIDFCMDDEHLGEETFHHWKHYEDDEGYKIKDCFCMFTAAKEIQTGWNASTADILAEDWNIIEE